MQLKHLTCPATRVKALDEAQGILEAVVNVYNLVDHGGDRVLLGCFKDSIARRRPYGCVYHDWQRPVAKTLDARELSPGDPLLPDEIRDYGGLYVKAQFNLETQDGRETFSNLARGVLDQFSIGYSVIEDRKAKDGATELVRGDLFEWSPVLWGMNPATAVVSVKDLQQKAVYLGEYAAEEMTLAALRDCCDSLFYRVIYGVLFDYGTTERSVDEKIAEIDAAIAEFHALCVQCLRSMLTAADGDDGEMETEYKNVFAVPARTAGRYDRQLLALHTEAEGACKRASEIADLRESQGRALCSPERFAQLKAVREAYTRLLDRLAPTPDDLDLPLLQMKANARRRRLVALGEGAYPQ